MALEQHSTSKITCDTERCGANERRGGLVNMRSVGGWIGWGHIDGKDLCPRCNPNYGRNRKPSSPEGETE